MAIVKDDVQVLRIYEHANSSLVLVLLGRRLGQLRVLAKGARRWLRRGFEGGFDLLARGELLAYARRDEQLWIFKEWDEELRPRGLGRSLDALRAGSFLCELAEALTRESAGAEPVPEDGGHVALFELLAQCAGELDCGAAEGPVVLHFTMRALADAGLLPDLQACSNCQTPLLERGRALAARLSYRGLECQECLASEALEALPASAPPPQSVRELARSNDAEVDGGPTNTSGRALVWLTPDALGALAFVQRTGKGVRLSRKAADAAARALRVLVHGALERDLRTLPGALQAIRAMGR